MLSRKPSHSDEVPAAPGIAALLVEDSVLLISNLVCGVDSKASVIGALTGREALTTNDARNRAAEFFP